jgi:hypothetical protein
VRSYSDAENATRKSTPAMKPYRTMVQTLRSLNDWNCHRILNKRAEREEYDREPAPGSEQRGGYRL